MQVTGNSQNSLWGGSMNVAARPTINGISLCSGVGMLDEGIQAAMRYLGFEYRTVCYVERDSYAAAALVARMESKALDQALVWDDLTTFPGRAFRGRVHSIAAGFPCQDISVAGRREGLDGKRSGLFFTILDIADDCEAELLFLENVAGIASATATVVYEGEELDERAAARVLGELADRRWNAEWLHLRAFDVGASHRRERWFCFAWRELAHGGHERLWRRAESKSERNGAFGELAPQGRSMDNTASARCDGARERSAAEQSRRQCVSGAGCAELEYAEGERFAQGRTEHELQQRSNTPAEYVRELGESDRTNCERGGYESREGRRQEPDGYAGLASGELFAPGPADVRWPGIIAANPELAPAIESGVCGMVDGVAVQLDEHRADRLRCGGNGVVALQAATAFVGLIRRAAR
jgi:DNA (cytosine-5)-methyltransferase 1